MRKLIVLTTVATLVLSFGWAGTAKADTIRVSQETSPGSGVFNLLGEIDIFDQSGVTAAGVYDYVPNPPDPSSGPCPVSYRGTVTPAILNTTQLFFVDTSDGRALFVVHDDKSNGESDCPTSDTGDTTGGNVQMRFDLDSTTPGYLLGDDPIPPNNPPPSNDTYNVFDPGVDGYAKNLVTVHLWDPPRTDGVAIGPLACDWTMDVRFMPPTGSIIGITAWKAVGADSS
jgi:hypothetical protein